MGELIWIFHPNIASRAAELVTIGLRLETRDEMMKEILAELERHKVDDLLPGHWSEVQQTWFINPDVWSCFHRMLAQNGYSFETLEAYMKLASLGHSTEVLQCQRHPENYILWLCAVFEEVLKKYERIGHITGNELKWLSAHKDHLMELKKRWSQTAEERGETAQAEKWLDDVEEQINSMFARLQPGEDENS